MFIAGKSTEPMGDSLQNVFHGDRKVLSVDAGETFEEVGRMVIKPSAPGGGQVIGRHCFLHFLWASKNGVEQHIFAQLLGFDGCLMVYSSSPPVEVRKVL